MTQHAKFLFDQDFSVLVDPEPIDPVDEVDAEPEGPPPVPLEDHERLIAEALENGRQQGIQEGLTMRREEEDLLRQQMFDQFANALEQLTFHLDGERDQIERSAISLSYQIAQKLSSELVAQMPREPVMALIERCIEPVRKAHHVAIRVNEADSDFIAEYAKSKTWQAGFEGRLIVLGEAEITRGDCRIEWADGGFELNHAAISDQVAMEVDGYLSTLVEKTPPVDADDDAMRAELAGVEDLTHNAVQEPNVSEGHVNG